MSAQPITPEARKAVVEAAERLVGHTVKSKDGIRAKDAAIVLLRYEAALQALEAENRQVRSDCEWADEQRQQNFNWATTAEARATAAEAEKSKLTEALHEARRIVARQAAISLPAKDVLAIIDAALAPQEGA